MKSLVFVSVVFIICHSAFSQEMEYPNVFGGVEITYLKIDENLLTDYQYDADARVLVNTSNTLIMIKVQTTTNDIDIFVVTLSEFGGSADLPEYPACFSFKKVAIGYKREVLPNAIGLVVFNVRPGEDAISVSTMTDKPLFTVYFKNSYRK
jgi:hypothetical protein